MLARDIQSRIQSHFPDAECLIKEFSGGTDHYQVTVISDAFEGKTLLARHRLIMALFQNEIDSGEIHALSLNTHTKNQWILKE